MAISLGKDLIVQTLQGSTYANFVAGAKSCAIKTKADIIEVSGPQSGQWKEKLAGRKDWSVTCSYLVSRGGIGRALDVGTTVQLRVFDTASGYWLEGTAIVETSDQLATVGNITTGTFSFAGSGPLTSGHAT